MKHKLSKAKRREESIKMEEWRIVFFTRECMWPKAGNKLLMKEVFAAYLKWKYKQRKEHSGLRKLSIDSFGRMFPDEIWGKPINRMHMAHRGEFGRGIKGFEIKKNALRAPTKDGKVEK